MTGLRSNLSAVLILAFTLAVPCAGQIRLVNMVPNSRSGEINQDAEPTITVDPNNHDHLAGSAFTWDNLTEGPMVTATAPIYVSTDGGNTWTLSFIVPSAVGSGFPTGDITLSFSSTPSGGTAHTTSWLYGGILSSTAAARPMTPLRSEDPFSSTLMTTLDTRSGNVDQPHTIAKSAGGVDRLYVGFNNGYDCVAAGGRSATVDLSQDANVATPTLGLDVVDDRNTACQDGFATVPAVNKDGTAYVAFIHDWSGTPRLVVVRDDNWGNSATPFSALTDPSDTVAGRFVTNALTLPSGAMGQNRLGASNVSIAVDPNKSDRVYVAWGDSNGSSSETIHVRRSINRGQDWSGDLLTVTSAMNPEIAINDIGIVGVLYQSVSSGNWQTYLSLSNNLDASSFNLPGTLFANQSASTPSATFSPYIGDYASLVAAGSDFYGMFSASNYPDKANFINGVQYQREVNWSTHTLYADAAHTTVVPPSIDPFFFAVPTNVCSREPLFCNICQRDPALCYPIYDPWWWLKCPACGITIYVDPGEEYEDILVYDTLGKEVGPLERLREPIVEKGQRFNYAIHVRSREGVGFVLQARARKGQRVRSFRPSYFVKLKGKERE